MFGIGMTLASGCGNKILIRIGGGNIKSIFVLVIAGLMALLMTRTDFYGLLFHSWMSPISPDLAKIGIGDQSIQTIIATLIGLDNNNIFVSLIIPLIICAMLLKYIFSSDTKLSNDNLLSGIVVGLVVTFAWLLTGGNLGQLWIENNDFLDTPYPAVGVQSFTFINPMGETLLFTSNIFDNFFLTFGVAALLSTIAGSFVYSILSNNLRLEWFVNKHDFFRHMIGGILIGIGGVLSLGCTIGQGVSGVSTLAVGSVITLFSIIFGASLMMKIEYYKAVYDDSGFFELLKNSLIDLKVLPEALRTLEKFNIFGALAQLVEQWPFKPFVTGSNPVRPKILNFILIILLSFSSEYIFADSNQSVQITYDSDIILNGNYLTNDQNDSVYF